MPTSSAKTINNNAAGANYSWIQMVADTIQRFSTEPSDNFHTMVQPCVIKGHMSVVYERNLHETQPLLFAYLQNFTIFNDMKLIEDRRKDRAHVIRERRQQWAPVVALGAGMMLRNTHRVGDELVPSTPHILRSGEKDRHARDIIEIAAQVRALGTFSKLESNSMLTPNLKRRYAINYYEHQIQEREAERVYSYFEGKNFHAVGYLSGDQICLNTLVAGGPYNAPRLWGPIQRMARDPVQLQYMRGRGGMDGFGIFKAVYYLEYAG